jgi:citrate lyase beta subunit
MLALRINHPSSAFGADDVAALCATGGPACDAVVIPKIEDTDTVVRVNDALRGEVPLWCMIETPLGAFRASEIAALGCVECLVFGSHDMTKSLRAQHTPNRAPLAFAMSQVVYAARAYGKSALDGVYTNVQDEQGLRAQCAQGRALGFDGTSLIHPSQIEVANSAFSPSLQEVQWAELIVDAWEKEGRGGTGVVVVQGRMVEELHVNEARRLLSLHRMIAERRVYPGK